MAGALRQLLLAFAAAIHTAVLQLMMLVLVVYWYGLVLGATLTILGDVGSPATALSCFIFQQQFRRTFGN